MADQISRLLSIMARLRDPEHGCEWDVAQNFKTIAPYTIEEAYEVADAIERNDMADLRGELGDLLLQVVFHARMAEEAGHFTFDDVARAISDKMEARHPHIFGDEGGVMDGQRWEDIKAAERADSGAESAMDGVAPALPALMRSEKLQKRAARVGFEWHDVKGPRDKLLEEIDELESASDEEKLVEAGDVLFVAVNIIRRYGVDAEEALRASNAKFERRFRAMEQMATADGKDFASLSLDEQEEYWQRVKRAEG
ncbi:nucleoside triphosphate pyrophosphohydrolase [Aurantiacibacter sp. MUD11]|uniref:nucleoside triphosphate pyrophosphohydrolase n=1 Tax=Aurantiacibacter sp. MUD11 TaxID=3003265 RepID=UPI0022AA1F58|nr:nucleoside triphosphate pyrophosphohydrolase [Aurantiacibacter sp. MUD11]WAT18334.1 nucleoside triphosphate pyrophosphohydrolase [Aurantiacibacter sp. MUD11]